MLPIDSPRWTQLQAAGGNPRLVPRMIQRLRVAPTEADWAEVWEQLSHQWTGSSIGYAALPHLVDIALRTGKATDPDFLLGLGRTVDALRALGPAPADLQESYEAALHAIRPAADQAARDSRYSPADYVSVLHAAAALTGRAGLGADLFFSLVASEPELTCPECEADLHGTFQDNGLFFHACDANMKPASPTAAVTPRQVSLNSASPSEDFDWLIGLCQASGQQNVLQQICLLYGRVTCPCCGNIIDVFENLVR